MHHRFVVVDGTDVKLNKGMAKRTGKDVHNKPHSQYIEKNKNNIKSFKNDQNTAFFKVGSKI